MVTVDENKSLNPAHVDLDVKHPKISEATNVALKVLTIAAGIAFAATLTLALLEIAPVIAPIISGIALLILGLALMPRSWINKLPEPMQKFYDFTAATIKELLVAPICGALMTMDWTDKKLVRNPDSDTAVEVDKIITLGSPFHGTKLAVVASFCPCAKQMQHDSPYTKGLRDWMETQKSVEYHHYGAEADVVVWPQRSVHVKSNNHPLFQGPGHLGLLFSDQVIDDLAKQLGQDAEKPILLVHGFLGHSSNWAYVHYRLEKMGFTNVFALNLGSPFNSIDGDYAPNVETEVRAIAAKTGRSDVTLVGHSMGGLVSTQAAMNLAKRDRAPSPAPSGSSDSSV